MIPPFLLEPNELSTSEGFAAACERPRAYVEEHIPGKHQPDAGGYWIWERFDDIPHRPIGCRCAVGYLLTALHGSLEGCEEIYEHIGDRFENLGVPYADVHAFEVGFDSATGVNVLSVASGQPYAQAGYELGRDWFSRQPSAPTDPLS